MDAQAIIEELTRLKIHIAVQGENLSITPPKYDTIDPEFLKKIKENKQALIRLLSSTVYYEPPPLVPAVREKAISLSFAQQRLWFINQFEEGNDTSYNLPWALRLEGKLNVTALKKTFQTIVDRHESLRTTFQTIDGKAVQVIAESLSLDIPVTQITEDEIVTYTNQNATHILDLSTGPLITVALLKLSEEEHILLINMHHIISDGWSGGILIREMKALYEAFSKEEPSPLEPLPIQYADFAIWQRNWLQGEVLEQHLNYWKQQLDDAPELLELPTDFSRPAVQTSNGSIEAFQIPKALSDQIIALARKERVTLFMLLMAAFQLLLSRYSGQSDICVGTPIANRKQSELAHLIGFFVNSLVIRTQIDDQLSFHKLLQQVKATSLAAFRHQDLPFEHLVETLNPERSLNHTPLFQVVLALHNIGDGSMSLSNLEITPVKQDIHTTLFDLVMHLSETDQGLRGSLTYSTDLFRVETIQQLLRHFNQLLESIVSEPEQIMSELPLLTEPEHQQLLYEWNQTNTDYPPINGIHTVFETWVEKIPSAIAITDSNQHLTYETLNQYSNQWAHCLIELGVGPEVTVGICLERSPELIIGLLGILKAGGAYLPIDPNYPAQRIDYMLKDAKVDVLLTQASLAESFTSSSLSHTLCLDSDTPTVKTYANTTPPVQISEHNLAYLIYTSGSTGTPKGVAVTHSNLYRLCHWHQHTFNVDSHSIATQMAGIGFDAMAWEVWPYLTTGAQLRVVPSDLILNPTELIGWLATNVVTHSFIPTPLTESCLQEAWPSSIALNYLFTGGDKLTTLPSADLSFELINNYGPTESTVVTTSGGISAHALVPPSIGRPIDNTQVYILDNTLHPVPIGVAGQLYTSGRGLARGYLHRPTLTAKSFVPNLFGQEPGGRLYKTGDRARYRPNGDIEFVGRVDDQVKIRGFRIELGEIDTCLQDHPAIKQCITIEREDSPGDKRLVTYLLSNPDYALSDTEAADLNTAAVDQWEDLYDSTYESAVDIDAPFEDFVGWNSSYTGEPIPIEEMKAWADTTVERILELKPQHLLEIGCGTGLLLGRLAAHFKSYVGTDISTQVLNQLEAKLPQLGEHAEKVTLMPGRADDLSALEGQSFDTIVMNSVVQYFPDIDYLANVLEACQKLLTPGGRIFVGDVRHLGLLEAFHSAIQWNLVQDNLDSVIDLKHLVQSHTANDKELVIAPAFFQAFQARNSGIAHTQIFPKLGDYQNELSQYRYDVVLHAEINQPLLNNIPWHNWAKDPISPEQIKARLVEEQPQVLGITHIANARVNKDVQLLQALHSHQQVEETLIEFKNQVDTIETDGITPYTLRQLAKAAGYTAEVSWARDSTEGAIDVFYFRHTNNQNNHPYCLFAKPQASLEDIPYQHLANNPRHRDISLAILPVLQDHLLQQLPDYMLPSFFVFLDQLPLTANGKIDRKSLPTPEAGAIQTTEYQAPSTELEQQFAAIWADILSIPEEKIGINDNFFDLGGHSLLVVKLAQVIKKKLDIDYNIKDFYEASTISELISLSQQGAREDEQVDISEANLEPDIQPCGKVAFNPKPKSIFLTGGTGFVGKYLLRDLLNKTDATIYCLVRAKSESDGLKRLKQAMIEWELWSSDYEERIVIIKGDLAYPKLGIDKNQYNHLCHTVDMIIHNGTYMHHLDTYDTMKATNVDGLKEIIRLACTTKQKLIQYISTTGVFSTALSNSTVIDEDSSITNQIHYKANGYTSTKWVAENVLINAQERDIPCNIYRLGLVSGDSETGRSDSAQWFTRLLKICSELSCSFEDNHTNWLPITPVDFVSNAIVTLTLSEHQNKTFHIGNPRSYGFSELIKKYNDTSNKSLNIIPYKDFTTLVKEQATSENTLPFVPFIHGKSVYRSERPTNKEPLTISSDKTITLLSHMDIKPPDVDGKLLSKYFDYIATLKIDTSNNLIKSKNYSIKR